MMGKRFVRGSAWLLLIMSACDRVVCKETYPLWKKLVVGLPIPVVVTMGVAAFAFMLVSVVLRENPRLRWAGLLVAGASCAVPLLAKLTPMGVLVLPMWIAAQLTALLLGGPPPQAWRTCTSWSRRIFAVILVLLFTFIMLLLTTGAIVLVDSAGQTCGGS